MKTAAQLVAETQRSSCATTSRAATKAAGRGRWRRRALNQRRYLEAIDQHDIVFGIGPAGTGKTYLAMAQAVSFLLAKKVSRIILARPAVEAGEKLGFLPGDLQEKVNPYLRPLYDALYDMMEIERVERLLERGTVEVAPLAFMRGRTLNDAFVILDEAQNTTSEQMKMFLTRLGFGSKAVVTGDITQIDLPNARDVRAGRGDEGRLAGRGHRVRPFRRQGRRAPRLVQQIVKAYEAFSRAASSRPGLTRTMPSDGSDPLPRLRVSVVDDADGRCARRRSPPGSPRRTRARPRRGDHRPRQRSPRAQAEPPVPRHGPRDRRPLVPRRDAGDGSSAADAADFDSPARGRLPR